MNVVWYKGLSEEQKAKRKQFLLANSEVFELLKEVLEKEFKESTPDYDNPSWAYKQADTNGANRMLRKVISLIGMKE